MNQNNLFTYWPLFSYVGDADVEIDLTNETVLEMVSNVTQTCVVLLLIIMLPLDEEEKNASYDLT